MSSAPTPSEASGGGPDSLAPIDRRIAALRHTMRTGNSRFARLVPAYWTEINKLLDLRLRLMRGDRPNRRARMLG